MAEIFLTESTARWLLGVAERSGAASAFESFAPHYCKMCGEAVAPKQLQGTRTDHSKRSRQELRANS